MSRVSIEGLTKKFAAKPPTTAVDDLSLDIEPGEFLVLLGPSGCGKTTTLRCLAGLETPDTGRISFADRTMFDSTAGIDVTPDKRLIGMVFQSYALWPHMTVRKNIRYPLRHRGVKGDQAAEWVQQTADLVDCGTLLDRYPSQLSGGQQQRVALARGIVSRPEVVLFDEPLSNLDARLRDQVRAQLHELHRRLGFTAVFVTHDQSEALALGSRLAIMRKGAIEQLDTPTRVFEEPATEYVADFIGMSNRIPIRRHGDEWLFGAVPIQGRLAVDPAHPEVAIRLRPDDLHLYPTAEDVKPGRANFPATVVDSQFGGRHMDVVVAVNGDRLHARVRSDSFRGWARDLEPDQAVVAGFAPETAMYYGPDETRVGGHADLSAPELSGA
jgi:iron(III) transport system ATP-binding protein